MAASFHILIPYFLLVVVNLNLAKNRALCKYEYLENIVRCRGGMKEHLTRGKFSEAIVGRRAQEVRYTDITHIEGSWYEGENNLTTLTVSFNSELRQLGNDSFTYLPGLESLDLSHNKIESLNVFVFHPLTTLCKLKLDHNNLQTLEAGVFSSQRKLISLSLSDNRLESLRNDFLSSLVMLEELHVGKNRLASLDSRSFVSLENMAFLNLSSNHLNVLPTSVFAYQKKLRELHLDKNNISALSTELFLPTKQIEILSFSDNKIRKISSAVLETLVRLKHLDAMRCPIKCNCSFKNFYQLCLVRSIKTSITCEESKHDLSVTVQQMECDIADKSTIVLLAITGIFTVGMLTNFLFGYFCKAENVSDERRMPEYANEYDYVESLPVAKSDTNHDTRTSKLQGYMSVLHADLRLYDYLQPIQWRLFNTATTDRQQATPDPTTPEYSNLSRPPFTVYDTACDYV